MWKGKIMYWKIDKINDRGLIQKYPQVVVILCFGGAYLLFILILIIKRGT